jgi:hypothetical protein
MLVAAILTLAVIATGVSVSAQDSGVTGGSGISLSPTRTELSILPGASDEVIITVRNVTGGTIIARPVINDFVADNETGDPRLLLVDEQDSAASIRGFIGALEDIELKPGESIDITVPINVPQNAFAGGYYGAIRYQAIPVGQASQGDGQVSLTASVASLVLIEVPGDIKQKVTVDYISGFLNNNQGSLFTKQPNFIGTSITNDGGSFVKPFGKVSILDVRGREVFTYELNNLTPRGNVLPSSTRLFKYRLVNTELRTVNGIEEREESSPIVWPGRYTVNADISYGNGGEIFTINSTFWYVPAWLIIVCVAIVIALFVGGIFLYRKHTTRFTKRRR